MEEAFVEDGSLSQDVVSHLMWITVIHSLQVNHPELCEAQGSWISWWNSWLSSLQSHSDFSQAGCVQEPVALTLVPGQQVQTRSHVSPQMPHSIQQTLNCPSTVLLLSPRHTKYLTLESHWSGLSLQLSRGTEAFPSHFRPSKLDSPADKTTKIPKWGAVGGCLIASKAAVTE